MPTASAKSPAPARIVVNPQEAADMLGVSRAHVYNLINNGTLRRYHVGGASRLRVDDVLALVGGGRDA